MRVDILEATQTFMKSCWTTSVPFKWCPALIWLTLILSFFFRFSYHRLLVTIYRPKYCSLLNFPFQILNFWLSDWFTAHRLLAENSALMPHKEIIPDVNREANLLSRNTVKTRIKEHVFWGFRLILFLYIGCFLQNQPENVLKVFLKLLLKNKYCIDYQQMKSMCKHYILINYSNGWN